MERILQQGLETWGLPTDAIPRLQEFSRLLLEKNRVMNLTAITDPADVARLHFLDCASLLTIADFRGKNVVDVGTGAGFPGMPLRLLEPDFDLTLLDSLGKRVDFLQETAQAMDLKRIQCVHARAEEFARQHREKFDIATSRAVAQLNVLCELALPLVEGRRPVPGHEVCGLRPGGPVRQKRHCPAGRKNWKNLGLHHSRYGHSSPGSDHSKAASYSGGLSPSLCPNQKSAAGLNPICIRGTWIWEKS